MLGIGIFCYVAAIDVHGELIVLIVNDNVDLLSSETKPASRNPCAGIVAFGRQRIHCSFRKSTVYCTEFPVQEPDPG